MSALVLPARLTHTEAQACLAMLRAGTQSDTPSAAVVVDATALSSFDSSALAVLLDCRRSCQAMGRSFTVLNMPPKLTELASLYGVAGLLTEPSAAPTAA